VIVPNGMDKIRLKGGPKQFKLGPGPTGRQRLERRIASLTLAAVRLTRKNPLSADGQWARELGLTLQSFTERMRK
jgi:hypothetical protein